MRNVCLGVLTFFLIGMSACVPMKKFEEKEALANKYLAQKKNCDEQLTKANLDLSEVNKENDRLNATLSELENEIATLQIAKKTLEIGILDLQKENSELALAQKNLLNSSSLKQKELMAQLADKETELALLEKELNKKEIELDALANSLISKENILNKLETDLESKVNRIDELESILTKKDSAMLALKNKISNALNGFSSDELTVEERDGKVYISLSEKLLFSSGSFTVGKNGEEALIKVAEVLKKQEDVDIVVEGHADNDKFNGTDQLKDNWDLSVKRATSVVRILVEENGLSPENVTAAGRSYYKPVAENESAEGKSKNRRTEIILSPKLEAILDLLKSE